MGTPTTRRGGARSRISGVPTVLPPAAQPVPTLLTLPDERTRSEPLPGVVHLPGWLDLGEQQALVGAFREWAAPPAGLRHPRVPTGHLMTVQSVCLGWHWQPVRLLPHRRRHRRRAGEAPARRTWSSSGGGPSPTRLGRGVRACGTNPTRRS